MNMKEIEEKYGKDFGKSINNEGTIRFLIDSGYPSLAKMLTIELPHWTNATQEEKIKILKRCNII